MIRKYITLPNMMPNPATQTKEGQEPYVNMEVENGIEVPAAKLEELRKKGVIKIVKSERISQLWFNNPEEKNYKARLRCVFETQFPTDFTSPNALLDPDTLAKYYHTVKHKVSEDSAIEVNTELTRVEYEILVNTYIQKTNVGPMVVKNRYYLECLGIDNKRVIVTADRYLNEKENLRVEFELVNPFDVEINIPKYFLE